MSYVIMNCPAYHGEDLCREKDYTRCHERHCVIKEIYEKYRNAGITNYLEAMEIDNVQD
jgi:hypothetical protein